MSTEPARYDFDRVFRLILTVGGFVAFCLFVYYLRDVLLPFAVALVLAYLLNPIATRIEAKTGRRWLAVLITLLSFVIICVAGTAFIVPRVFAELAEFSTHIKKINADDPTLGGWLTKLPPHFEQQVSQALQELTKQLDQGFVVEAAKKVLPRLWGIVTGGLSLVLSLMTIVVIFLYLAFLLLDFRRLQDKWKDYLPPAHRESIVAFVTEFHDAMSIYFRGQFMVAMSVGVLFSIGFAIIGLRLPVMLGLGIGLLNMVPYLQIAGMVPALTLGILRALETGDSVPMTLLAVIAVFAIVQLIQDAVLTPTIIGDKTGLRPVVILLGLTIWGKTPRLPRLGPGHPPHLPGLRLLPTLPRKNESSRLQPNHNRNHNRRLNGRCRNERPPPWPESWDVRAESRGGPVSCCFSAWPSPEPVPTSSTTSNRPPFGSSSPASSGGGAACLFFTGAVYAMGQQRKTRQLRQRFPDQPWMWRPEWAEKVVPSRTGLKAASIWAGALIWNAITLPALAAALTSQRLEGFLYYVLFWLIVFALIGLGLIARAIRATLQSRRFGRSRLELETLPGLIGGHLRGKLVIVGNVAALDSVAVTLRCVHSFTADTGGESTTRETTLWAETQPHEALGTRFAQREIELPVDFQIPYACRPSDDADPENQIEWCISAEAPIAGLDLDLSFDVPAFKTEASDPSVGRSETAIAAENEIVYSDAVPSPDRIQRKRDQLGHTCLTISCWPGWPTALTIFALALLLTNSAFFLFLVFGDDVRSISSESLSSMAVELFMMAVVLLLALGFALAGLVLWLILSTFPGSYHLTLADDHLAVHRRHPLLRSRKELPLSDIKEITYKQTGRYGETRYFTLHAITTTGKKTTLATGIKGQLPTRWLAQQIESHLTHPK